LLDLRTSQPEGPCKIRCFFGGLAANFEAVNYAFGN